MNRMKRNTQGTYDTVRSVHDKVRRNESDTKMVIDLLREIKSDMRQFTFHMRMDSVDLSEYFPLRNDKDLDRFMNREDEEWPLRRRGFYHLLFNTVTKQKNRFASALLHTLFSRDFIANHRWHFAG